MKAKLTKPPEGRTAGEIVEHSDAHMLVELGIAEPADDECSERIAMFHATRGEIKKRERLDRAKQKDVARVRAAAALKASQQEFAGRLGLETADDARAMGAEKRGQPQ